MFWVTGKSIKDVEKQYQKDYVLVFCKKKAQADIRVFIERSITYLLQISAYHNTKKGGFKEDLLLLQDNLACKV